jgi:hypothetical protein
MSAVNTESPYVYGFKANGNVQPGIFVKQDATLDWGIVQCAGGDIPFGVSELTHRNPPYLTLDDGYTAVSPEGLGIAPCAQGKIVYVVAGAAITRGAYLKPNSSAQAVATTTSTDVVAAIALQSASGAGVAIRCILIAPKQYQS